MRLMLREYLQNQKVGTQERQRILRAEVELLDAAISEIPALDCGLKEKESIREYLDRKKSMAVSGLKVAQEEVYQITKLLLMIG